jgi:hypothetical protein
LQAWFLEAWIMPRRECELGESWGSAAHPAMHGELATTLRGLPDADKRNGELSSRGRDTSCSQSEGALRSDEGVHDSWSTVSLLSNEVNDIVTLAI